MGSAQSPGTAGAESHSLASSEDGSTSAVVAHSPAVPKSSGKGSTPQANPTPAPLLKPLHPKSLTHSLLPSRPNDSTKPPLELPEDVWKEVIPLLLRPLPRPTGNNYRSDIRQHDLASCMRTCKLLNNIAGPLLYKVIITDHLPSLLYGHDHRLSVPSPVETIVDPWMPPIVLPALYQAPFPSTMAHTYIQGIPNKAELLAYNERLFLEYGEKVYSTYEQIMRKRHNFGHIGLYDEDLDDDSLEELFGRECDEIEKFADILCGMDSKRWTYSLGVFLSGQSASWKRLLHCAEVGPKGEGESQRAYPAKYAISRIAMAHPTYFCQRAAFGPFSHGSLYGPSREAAVAPGRPSHLAYRAHLDMCLVIPATVVGSSCMWYFHVDRQKLQTRADVAAAFRELSDLVSIFLETRESALSRLVHQQGMARIVSGASVHINIYVPSVMMAPEWLRMTRSSVEIPQEVIRERGDVSASQRMAKDVWKMLDLKDAPPCEACGWCPKDDGF